MAKKVNCKALAAEAKALAKQIANTQRAITAEETILARLKTKLEAVQKKQSDGGCV